MLLAARQQKSRTVTCCASTIEPKICRNCKHAVRDKYAKDEIVCRKMDTRDIVTGDLHRTSACDVRKNDDYCGPSGQWFEEKNILQHFFFRIHPMNVYDIILYMMLLLLLFINILQVCKGL